MPSSPLKRVLILHTGGTLGMVGGQAGALSPGGGALDALAHHIPELFEIADLRLEILARQDSCEVRAEQWLTWAARIRAETWADGIVLIHGTDTMAYTASALSFLLPERRCPIILTGSQRPLSAIRNDARQNLVDALILAGGPLREVVVCFDSLGLRGNRTLKRSSHAMGAFESPNCRPLATLGVEVRYAEHGLRSGGAPEPLAMSERVKLSWVVPELPAPEPWAAEGPAVHVVAALGCGNFPLHTGWQSLVKQEAKRGISHLVISQCPHGTVLPGLYAASRPLFEEGALSGGDMTYPAALAKARVGLGRGLSGPALSAYLEGNQAGECEGVS